MVPFALVGIAIWAVLGLVLLVFHHWVTTHGHTNWLWTCLAGVLWGLPGLYVVWRHDRHRAQRLGASVVLGRLVLHRLARPRLDA